jgi:hypothetical protein
VPVETAEGRAEYVLRQRGFAASGAVLRTRLVAALDVLTSLVPIDHALSGRPESA